jgi:hypothetical protein
MVAVLQRQIFNPPTFGRAQWDIDEQRPSKLKDRPLMHYRKRRS